VVKVGQTLWRVRRGHHSSSSTVEDEVTVSKVGRVWFYLEGVRYLRYCLETMQEDAGKYTSYCRCYLSKEEYRTSLERDRVWGLFRKETQYWHSPPKSVSLEDIYDVCRILGIDPKIPSEIA